MEATMIEQPKKRSRGRPFSPGDPRINRGGRPKEAANVRDLARAHTEEAFEVLLSVMREGSENARVRAAEAVLARGWGRAEVEAPEPCRCSQEGAEAMSRAAMEKLTDEEVLQLEAILVKLQPAEAR